VAGFLAQGATCSFSPISGGGGDVVTFTATRLAVTEPEAIVVDMTPANATSTATFVLVPTGEWANHGSVDVDFICGTATTSLKSIIGKRGTLAFNSPSFNVTMNAIAVSGGIDASFGSVVSGRASFRVTTSTAT
jgi:hypothetical protein